MERIFQKIRNAIYTNKTCSRWLLSAYPLTKSQYRVVAKLGPGRSSMLFSLPTSLADWTLRCLRLGAMVAGRHLDGEALEVSTEGQAGAATTRENIVPNARVRGLYCVLTTAHVSVPLRWTAAVLQYLITTKSPADVGPPPLTASHTGPAEHGSREECKIASPTVAGI